MCLQLCACVCECKCMELYLEFQHFSCCFIFTIRIRQSQNRFKKLNCSSHFFKNKFTATSENKAAENGPNFFEKSYFFTIFKIFFDDKGVSLLTCSTFIVISMDERPTQVTWPHSFTSKYGDKVVLYKSRSIMQDYAMTYQS